MSNAFADTQMPDTPLTPQGQVYSTSALEIMWQRTNDDTGVVEYRVYRNSVMVFNGDALSYFDNTVSNNQLYSYAVSAVDAAGNESELSELLELRVGTPVTIPSPDTDLFQPSNLTANTAENSVILQWQPPTGDRDIAGYNVYRDDQYIDTVQSTTYTDAIDENQTATYYVVAFDTTPEFSIRSNEVIANDSEPTSPDQNPDEPTDLFSPPDGLALSAVESSSLVLSWDNNTRYVGYNLYRDGAYYTTVFETTFEDVGLEPSTQYSYYLTGFDGNGNFSAASNELSATTESDEDQSPPTTIDPDPTRPGAPELLLGTDDRVVIGWEASTSNQRVTGYNIFRNGEYYTTVFEPTFIDRFVAPDTEYSYYVMGYNEDVTFSEASPTSTITSGTAAGVVSTDGQPAAPANLTELLVGNDWAELRWDPVTADQGIIAYQIHRDGELLYSVPTTPENNEDQRYASTNSYLDCNRTRAYERCLLDQPDVGALHTYTVHAVGANNLVSPPSNSLTLKLHDETGQTPVGMLQDFELVFSDEFNGPTLNGAHWNTRLPWGPDTTINDEQQYYVDVQNNPEFGYNPFEMTGDTLKISGIVTPPELSDAANNQPFLSGTITSRDQFNMAYGYVEGRMKLAAPTGALSSFYLFHTWPALNAPEIDIVEYIGQTPDVAYQTYHYVDEQYGLAPHPTPTMFEPIESGNWSDDFHIYSVLWEPNLVIWYIDGEEIKRVAGPQVSRQSMYIIAYLVLGSEWALTPDIEAPIFPITYEIDYIRAYQRPEFIRNQ